MLKQIFTIVFLLCVYANKAQRANMVVSPINEDFASFNYNMKYDSSGIIDKNLNIVLPNYYKNPKPLGNNLFYISLGSFNMNSYIIDANGKKLMITNMKIII